jgi:hypothetical protein
MRQIAGIGGFTAEGKYPAASPNRSPDLRWDRPDCSRPSAPGTPAGAGFALPLNRGCPDHPAPALRAPSPFLGGGEGQAITPGRHLSPALSPIGWRRGSPPDEFPGLCPAAPPRRQAHWFIVAACPCGVCCQRTQRSPRQSGVRNRRAAAGDPLSPGERVRVRAGNLHADEPPKDGAARAQLTLTVALPPSDGGEGVHRTNFRGCAQLRPPDGRRIGSSWPLVRAGLLPVNAAQSSSVGRAESTGGGGRSPLPPREREPRCHPRFPPQTPGRRTVRQTHPDTMKNAPPTDPSREMDGGNPAPRLAFIPVTKSAHP